MPLDIEGPYSPGLGFGQNANLFTGIVNYDFLLSSRENYDTSRDRLSRVMTLIELKTLVNFGPSHRE